MMDHLNKLVLSARKNSQFYAELYKSLEHVTNLHDLPIIDHGQLWAAAAQEPRQILTGDHDDGIVMRTGGTTGISKLTFYSQVDLQRAVHSVGVGIMGAGLQAGDKIANLFAVGDLYGSFILVTLSLVALPVPTVTVPLSWTVSPDIIRDRLEQCGVTVLMGPPTVLTKLALHCVQRGRESTKVRTIMYAGEGVSENQKTILQQAFPNVHTLRPLVYASIDGGIMASSAATEDNEDHTLLRAFPNVVYLEIVTEDDEKRNIERNNIAGAIIVTNLSRQLQPVLRYPTGDRAEWVDFERGIFRLLGRSSAIIRLSMVSFDVLPLQHALVQFLPSASAMQIVIQQTDEGIDELTISLAVSVADEAATRDGVKQIFSKELPVISEQIRNEHIAPLKVLFVQLSDIRMDPWSGKAKSIVDLRVRSS